MTRFSFTLVLAVLLAAAFTGNKTEAQNSAADSVDRTVLPVPEPKYPPITELDANNAKAPPRFQVKAPKRRAQCGGDPPRQLRLRRRSYVRRADPDADAGAARQNGAALQQFQSATACVPLAAWLCLPAATAIAPTLA